MGGVLQAVMKLLLVVEERGESRDAMSCGGDERGVEVAAADPLQIVFCCGVFGVQGVLAGGAEVKLTGNCGIIGGAGSGFSFRCSWLVSRNWVEECVERNIRNGIVGGVL